MNVHDTAEVVRAYHDAWTHKDFATARALLASTLVVEVPINSYPTAESFAAALEGFASMVTSIELLAAMSEGNGIVTAKPGDAPADQAMTYAWQLTIHAAPGQGALSSDVVVQGRRSRLAGKQGEGLVPQR